MLVLGLNHNHISRHITANGSVHTDRTVPVVVQYNLQLQLPSTRR